MAKAQAETLTQRVLKKAKKQKGGGSKKHGRNKVKCEYYRKVRSVRNKLAKLRKHIAVHVNDKNATDALELVS